MEEIEWTKGRRRAEKGSETKGDEIGGGKKKEGEEKKRERKVAEGASPRSSWFRIKL